MKAYDWNELLKLKKPELEKILNEKRNEHYSLIQDNYRIMANILSTQELIKLQYKK